MTTNIYISLAFNTFSNHFFQNKKMILNNCKLNYKLIYEIQIREKLICWL